MNQLLALGEFIGLLAPGIRELEERFEDKDDRYSR
jgi:hypothetical protein